MYISRADTCTSRSRSSSDTHSELTTLSFSYQITHFKYKIQHFECKIHRFEFKIHFHLLLYDAGIGKDGTYYVGQMLQIIKSFQCKNRHLFMRIMIVCRCKSCSIVCRKCFQCISDLHLLDSLEFRFFLGDEALPEDIKYFHKQWVPDCHFKLLFRVAIACFNIKFIILKQNSHHCQYMILDLKKQTRRDAPQRPHIAIPQARIDSDSRRIRSDHRHLAPQNSSF